MFQAGFLSIIRSLLKYHSNSYMSYRLRWLRIPLARKPVWHIPIAVCTVLDYWWWTERLSETCRVLLQKKNKFEELVHLVVFIITIYHNTRSSECQVLSTQNPKFWHNDFCAELFLVKSRSVYILSLVRSLVYNPVVLLLPSYTPSKTSSRKKKL